MRVLYFGTYERDYPRNAQVISALRRAGVDVVEHHVAVWESERHKWQAGARSAGRLALAELQLLRRPSGDFDAVIVGYPGHLDLPAARRAAHGKPVVFNPLVSLADTLVGDRGRFAPGSFPARALASIDRRALCAAELVGLPRERVQACLVGAEERVFTPGWEPRQPFTALFVGKLIPLHGLETV